MDIGLNGALVHARRVAAGLTVAALADRVGVHSFVIWAIEEGNERQLEHLPIVTIVALAHSLDLHPGDMFSDRDQSPTRPTPDDIALEAALLQHGEAIAQDDLAAALDWPLARVERAFAALHHRLAPTGARLHPTGVNAYVIASNRNALTTQQWIQLGRARSGHVPLTEDAATELYHLIALQTSPAAVPRRRSAPRAWRTDEWDDENEPLRQLREQQLLDSSGSCFTLLPTSATA
ncbi:MAG: hypothetical protein M3069_26525 [Chloroflexota bacterium]|nr:hypothetical protein [Chloroflexota bacterium]